jgi:o-succinylbenzoate---CoA ligase
MAFWIHAARGKQPDRPAIEGPSRSLTYQQLSEEAIGVAGALGRMGVRGGDRVALALPEVEDFAVALHGSLLAKAVAVPVDLRFTEEERAERLAGAEIVLTELPPPAPIGMPGAFGDGPITLMHTSGTTAAPKQVALTHGNWLANALGSAVALGLDPAERWLCPMPLTHVGGLSIPIRSSIYATTAVVHGRFDVERVLNELMDPARRITLVSLVPTMLSRLLDAGLKRPPSLRWVLLGGGPIAAALLERASEAGVPVAPSYGMTETCSQIVTFGWPLPGAEVWTSSEGEVVVRGPMVARGALDHEGRLFTGDLGAFDERGRLVITGRKADTIVTGGENVAPAEVEDVLLTHPAVADAAVFARPDAEWGEAVVASVVLRDGADAGPEELRAFCGARLAGFKVPKAFEFVPALPRSQTGKLLRRELV